MFFRAVAVSQDGVAKSLLRCAESAFPLEDPLAGQRKGLQRVHIADGLKHSSWLQGTKASPVCQIMR
jgi:hypothetical protein